MSSKSSSSFWRRFSRSAVGRYSVSLVAVAAALILRRLLGPYLGTHSVYLTLYPFIVALAVYVGVGPSVVAVILGGMGATYWFMEPGGFFEIHDIPTFLARSSVFLVASASIIVAGEVNRRTQRARAKQTADEIEALLRLHEVSIRCMGTETGFEESLHAILDAAVSLTHAARGNIRLLDRSTGLLTLMAHRGFEKPYLDFFHGVRSSNSWGAALESRQRVIIEDALENKIFRAGPELQALCNAGVRAAQSTPVISSLGSFMGVITTHYNEPHRPTERELRLMDLLAREAADYLERRQSEEALKASSAQLLRFLEAAPTGLTRCSRDLRYLSANEAYAQIAGVPVNQIVGRPIVDVIGPEAWKAIQRHVERVLDGERVEYEALLPFSGSGSRQLHVVYTPERDGQSVVGWVASVADITEFKRLEKQLQEVEKMAAAGQLAASLAHEINNPLMAIVNVLYLLSDRSDLDPVSTGLIAMANNEAARLSRIVKQSLSYYRAGTTAQEVDLAALIEESAQVFSHKSERAGVAISKEIVPGTSVVGFADEIRQVVDNLLLNAVEATPRGGGVTLCLRPSHNWKNRNERGLRLTVADSGCGIPQAHLARIFEPFFTTKAEKGNGLGLWVVKGIVEKHGGNVKVRSTDAPRKSGTVVSIFWPSAFKARSARLAS